MATRVNAPSRPAADGGHAAGQVAGGRAVGELGRRAGARPPRCRCRWRISTPARSSSRRRAAKFSMMPLWITATWPRGVGVRVGVAVGRPAVRGPAGVAHTGGARSARPRRSSMSFSRLASAPGLARGVQATLRRPGRRRRRSRSRGTPAGADLRASAGGPAGDRCTRRCRTWLSRLVAGEAAPRHSCGWCAERVIGTAAAHVARHGDGGRTNLPSPGR